METCDSEMSQIARSMDSSSSDMLQIAWKMYAAKNHEFEVNKTYHIFFCYPYVSPTCGRWRRRDRKCGFLIRLIWAQPKTANMFAQGSIQMYHFVVGFVATTFCALTHTHMHFIQMDLHDSYLESMFCRMYFHGNHEN